jgi:hypothetical protein
LGLIGAVWGGTEEVKEPYKCPVPFF